VSGTRLTARVAIPKHAAGVLAKWVDRCSPDERGHGLPSGVTVSDEPPPPESSASSAPNSSASSAAAAAAGEAQLLSGFHKLLGKAPADPGVAAHCQRQGLALRPRSQHAKRALLGILGYESDDECDEVFFFQFPESPTPFFKKINHDLLACACFGQTDGGPRLYEGSSLCLELAATTREGKVTRKPRSPLNLDGLLPLLEVHILKKSFLCGQVHVLPEELLGLVLVDLKARTAKAREGNAPKAV
jgi:hypothetical protein